MKKLNGMIVSIIGLGIVVGSLATALNFQTIMLSIGLGIMLGGVFKEIREIKDKMEKPD